MTTTTKRLAAITAGGVLFLVVIWYLALFSPQNHKLASAHRARSSAEQKIATLNGQITQLVGLEKEKPADTQKLAIYTAAVPDNPQLSSALQQIQGAADKSGVYMSAVSPSTPAGAGGSASSSTSGSSTGTPSISVVLSASGSYQQVTAFIAALESMPRTLVINSLNLSASGNNSIQASLTTNIFYAGQPTP